MGYFKEGNDWSQEKKNVAAIKVLKYFELHFRVLPSVASRGIGVKRFNTIISTFSFTPLLSRYIVSIVKGN